MEKKKAADQTPNNDKKQALDTAIRQIEKNFGKGAVMRLGDRPDLQVDAIPTGSLALDAALGIGGVPKGRIIEIYGPESSGKTTLALHIVAQAQKRGGEVAFVDAEHALDPDYAARIGVDIDSMLVSQPDTGEQALELTDKNDIKDEQSMLKGIIRFGDETAKEVMTSRQDIVDLDISCSFADVLKCIVENNYSRIPVYQENEDNMRGVLYIKDLLPHLSKPANFRWQSLIRPPYFVPETKKIDDLMREFQENKVHIAIVVDEFGGTSGIVTLEDILEEIVGEINDEYDEDTKNYSKLNYNTYLFEGKTLLTDFCKDLNVDDDEFADVEGDADTLAGLLLEIKGDFPSMHEKIDYKNYTFEVMAIDERRISKVKVTVHEKKYVKEEEKD